VKAVAFNSSSALLSPRFGFLKVLVPVSPQSVTPWFIDQKRYYVPGTLDIHRTVCIINILDCSSKIFPGSTISKLIHTGQYQNFSCEPVTESIGAEISGIVLTDSDECLFKFRFGGMSVQQSQPILCDLYAHCTKPEFTCRFRWTPHTVAI
jgi:hypothetical protein